MNTSLPNEFGGMFNEELFHGATRQFTNQIFDELGYEQCTELYKVLEDKLTLHFGQIHWALVNV